MNTPYFIIHKELLDKNIKEFFMGIQSNWSETICSYSVKTNSLPWLLTYLKIEGWKAEVVSDEEFELALKCGYEYSDIIFNGPIKGKRAFLNAISKGSFVNIDSEKELRWIEEYGLPIEHLGIRINIPPEVFNEEDIEYSSDGFRFGFSVENGSFRNALERLSKSQDIQHIGIHLHCNSITRSKNVYRSIARYAATISEAYHLEPYYIDIGGGFFGGVPGKTSIDEYFSVISSELKKVSNFNHSILIAEPGSAIIGSVVDLYTSVVDVKDTTHSRIVTTDGGRIFIDPQWFRSSYLYSIKSSSQRLFEGKQLVCGYTCMDHDRIMELNNEIELNQGDEIIYHRVGSYTVTFGGPFIKYYPEVYVCDKDSIIKIRDKMTVDDYFKIHSIGG